MAAAGLDEYSEEMCILRGSVCFRDPASERQFPRDPLANDPANGDECAPGDSVERGFD